MPATRPQDSLDRLIDAMPRAGPSTAQKKEVTYDEFQRILDSTPLFMRGTPAEDEDDPVLQGLKSLMMDGDGDGEDILRHRLLSTSLNPALCFKAVPPKPSIADEASLG